MKAPHIVFQHIVNQPTPVRAAQPERTRSVPSLWQRLAEQIFQGLTADYQLKVTQRRDRAGDEYYQIYQPFSGQTKIFNSRQNALVWLDRHRC